MPSISLPAGSYALPSASASCRRLINVFSEGAPTDDPNDVKSTDGDASPDILRRGHGVTPFATLGMAPNGNVRGMWIMNDLVYAVCGKYLYSVSQSGQVIQLGGLVQIPGTGPVRMTDNGYCLVIILPGTNIGYTFTWVNQSLASLVDPTFLQLGAIDLGYIDTYIVFLQLDGRGFYNSDSQSVSDQGVITFTQVSQFLREQGTDLLVGMIIDHRDVLMLGRKVSEAFYDAGNAVGSPFSSSPNGNIQMGCAAGASVAMVDQSPIWLANDRTVRRRNGQTPLRISNHGIEAVLNKAATLSDAYAMTFTDSGHIFYVLTLPTAQRTLVYDCTHRQWHERASYLLGYWRPSCMLQAYGKTLVGDSQSNVLGFLDVTANTEFGTVISSRWIHQAVYGENKNLLHDKLEVIINPGEGPVNTNPTLTLMVSDDGGDTFRTFPGVTAGTNGERRIRQIWTNLGMSRQRVYSFQMSDVFPLWAVDCQLDYRKTAS
jgi:hypothetical protein